jgi:integrase
MRGGMGSQVTAIFNLSGIFQPGESKHAAKAEARESGASTWAEIGEKTAIYSYSTAEAYKDVWHQCCNFLKETEGLKDIEKLNGEGVTAYLESRIEAGISRATYSKEAAALGKLQVALNAYADMRGNGTNYDLRSGIRELAVEAKQLEKSDPHRAYSAPEKLISKIEKADYKLAAELQFHGGARINEISKIKPEQLKGINGTQGKMTVAGKGGKVRNLSISEKTYKELELHIEKNGLYQIDKNSYRRELKNAAERSGQEYTGSHGLRWNYAQNRMVEIQQSGKSYEQGLREVSHAMGHERSDITEHYLR